MISKRLLTSAAAAAIVFGACGSGQASPTPTQAPTSAPASSSATASASTSGSAGGSSAVDQALFGTNYKPETNVPTGGTIVMGEWEAPDTLNAFTNTSVATVEAVVPVSRAFLTITSDGKYVPDLAESIPTTENGGVKINPDGKTFDVTVKLKPNLKWSDGQPLTMNDWKFTVQYLQQEIAGCTACAIGFPFIGSVDVSSDGLTGVMHFKQLYAGWLGFLAGPSSAILPEHYFKNIPATAFAKSMPVSDAAAKIPWSGPFMIQAASKSEIDYVPNPNWAGGVSGPHAPYLAGLKFKFYSDLAGMQADFLAGNVDVALDMTQADYPAIQKVDPSVGTAELTPAWQYEHFDINNDPNKTRGNGLWDPNVRKAIYMSVNKQDLVSKVFPGQTVEPEPCTRTPPGLWFRDESLTCPKYDVAGAKTLLQQAGMTAGPDGNMQLNGKTVDLQLCTTSGNPTRLTELQLLQGYLGAIGIKSHIQTADATTNVFAGWSDTKPDTLCSIYRGNYDIADFAYLLGSDIYSNNYPAYNSTQWPELEASKHQGQNTTRFKSQAMDEATNSVATEVDLAKQLDAAKAIQKAYVDGVPEIPIYYRNETTGVSVHIGNWPKYNPSSIGATWNVEDWYFKK